MSISLTGVSNRPNCAEACGALQHQSQPEVSLHQASTSFLVEFLHFCDVGRCSCFSSKDIFGTKSWTTWWSNPGVLFLLSTEQNRKLVFVNLHNWIQKMTEAMLLSWLSRCQTGQPGTSVTPTFIVPHAWMHRRAPRFTLAAYPKSFSMKTKMNETQRYKDFMVFFMFISNVL